MPQAFDRDALLAAFDRLGRAAARAGTKLEIVVYGGSALMLASNFRYATEDVDIAEIETPWPDWLAAEVAAIAHDNGWSEEWLNDAVQFHLSPLARFERDHVAYGTFPRTSEEEPGLVVFVPTAEYLLALKLKAMRLTDPKKELSERADIENLCRVVGISTVDAAISLMGTYFPRSAAAAEKQRWLLERMWPPKGADHAPEYPARGVRADQSRPVDE